MILDQKSNKGYEFPNLSPPHKELLFMSLRYLKSTLEIALRSNRLTWFTHHTYIYEYMARKKEGNQPTERIVIELLTE